MKAILIIGLPGSGKTHLAKTKYVPEGYLLIDDPKNKDTIIGPSDKIVICDPFLCIERNRVSCIQFLENAGYKIETIYFENNPEKCQNNITHRDDGREIYLEAFEYNIPENQPTLEIWQLSK
jgi:hypothetical protein